MADAAGLRAEAGARRLPRRRGRWRGIVLPAVLLLVAEIALRGRASDALAPPSAVFVEFGAMLGDAALWRATLETLACALAGLALGALVGGALGLWFGLAPRAARAGSLTVELLRPVPAVALIPLAMLVFGLGWRMEIAVVALSCIWPMLLLVRNATAQVDARLTDVARLLGLAGARRVVRLILPAATARLAVALRLTFGVAMVIAVSVEIVANPQGLGAAMMDAQQSLAPARLLALLSWTGALGWASNALLLAVERALAHDRRAAGALR